MTPEHQTTSWTPAAWTVAGSCTSPWTKRTSPWRSTKAGVGPMRSSAVTRVAPASRAAKAIAPSTFHIAPTSRNERPGAKRATSSSRGGVLVFTSRDPNPRPPRIDALVRALGDERAQPAQCLVDVGEARVQRRDPQAHDVGRAEVGHDVGLL